MDRKTGMAKLTMEPQIGPFNISGVEKVRKRSRKVAFEDWFIGLPFYHEEIFRFLKHYHYI